MVPAAGEFDSSSSASRVQLGEGGGVEQPCLRFFFAKAKKDGAQRRRFFAQLFGQLFRNVLENFRSRSP